MVPGKLQWKLDMQHYDAVIDHVPGEQNISADVFSRLVPKLTDTTLNQILILQCTDTQRSLIQGKPSMAACTLWG